MSRRATLQYEEYKYDQLKPPSAFFPYAPEEPEDSNVPEPVIVNAYHTNQVIELFIGDASFTFDINEKFPIASKSYREATIQFSPFFEFWSVTLRFENVQWEGDHFPSLEVAAACALNVLHEKGYNLIHD